MNKFINKTFLIIIIIIPVCMYVFITNFQPSHFAAHYETKHIKITIKLKKDHLYLPEYERYLTVEMNGKKLKHKMFTDTGGYTRVNLYQTQFNKYIIRGYFNTYIINTKKFTIKEESNRSLENGNYLGGFIWAPKYEVWKFVSANKLSERKLEPKGG